MDAAAARRLSFCFARLHDNDHQQSNLSSSFLSITTTTTKNPKPLSLNDNQQQIQSFSLAFYFLHDPKFLVFSLHDNNKPKLFFFSLMWLVSTEGV
jgi:hypothetical protein